MPTGTTIEHMNNLISKVEEYLNSHLGHHNFIAKIFSGQHGSLEIIFDKADETGPLPLQFKHLLSTKVKEWGGVEWNIYGIGKGFSNIENEVMPTFLVKMTGYNYDDLDNHANKLKEVFLANKRISNINLNERRDQLDKKGQEFVLDINPKSANLSGISPQQLFYEVGKWADQSNSIANISISGNRYPIVIKDRNSSNFSSWDLMNRHTVINQRHIKLGEFSKISTQSVNTSIVRENRQYVRFVGLDYLGSYEMGEHYLERVIKEINTKLPMGYKTENYNKRETLERVGNDLYLIILMLVIIYITCSILFENLKQPLFILTTIPISFIGIFLVFYQFEISFDQGCFASFIMTGALVVNSAILIVSDFNISLKYAQENPKRDWILMKVLFKRGRTVFLTTVAAICGLLPIILADGNESFWFSLATGTVGGLVFSLISTFLVLPVLLTQKK